MFDLNYIELLQWIFAGLVLLILINNLYLIIKSNSRMMEQNNVGGFITFSKWNQLMKI